MQPPSQGTLPPSLRETWVRGCIVCISVSTLQSIMQIYCEIVYISVQKLILNMQMKVDVSVSNIITNKSKIFVIWMCHILSAQVKIKLSSELVTADQKILQI